MAESVIPRGYATYWVCPLCPLEGHLVVLERLLETAPGDVHRAAEDWIEHHERRRHGIGAESE